MFINRCYACLTINCFLFIILFLWGNKLDAQTRNLDRPFDPVIITGNHLAEYTGVSVDDIFVAAFDSTKGTWEIIPFQFDEKDISGSFLVPDVNTGLDDDDELVIMARDAGDRAPDSWLDNTDSEAFKRVEIGISDANELNKMAWIYVYRIPANKPPLNPTDYVTYRRNQATPAADSVVGKTYKVANAMNGLPNYITIPPEAGGTGIDLLDKQELYIKTSLGLAFNETSNFQSKGVEIKDGSIRVIRELFMDIVFLGSPVFPDLMLPMSYYGYSLDIIANFNIPTEIKIGALSVNITQLRQSFNLTQNAQGMKFFSANNSNIPIDGNPESIDDTVVLTPNGVNRLLFTGPQGTFVNNYTIPGLGANQRLFYEDDAAADSYGNSGFVLEGSDVEGPAPLGLTILFPGAINPGEEAKFTNTDINELIIEATPQSFGEVTSVEIVSNRASIPDIFSLSQNFPNPFNPTTEIQYQLPKLERITSAKSRVVLKIYNILGEEIRTLVNKNQSPGFYTVTWDARNNTGGEVSSGVYIYQLSYGSFRATKKLILVK